MSAAGAQRTPPGAIEAATGDQPRARMALAAALADPVHAYLLRGPAGTGKRAAARAFAAELLAAGSGDPEGTRRRILAESPLHPDLVLLRPPGAQHLVDDVRELVIRGVAYRPVEAERRVFILEAAEALGDESQNALLKTLEEPPSFAHLLLVSSEPELLLETIVSRCQPVPFEPLAPDAVEARLVDADAPEAERRAAARLCGGDAGRARFLLSAEGRGLRAEAEACARGAIAGDLHGTPWMGLLARAEEAAEQASDAVADEVEATLGGGAARGREAGRIRRLGAEEARRAGRRRRTATLDLGLELCAAWYRDVAVVAGGAAELAFNADRGDALGEDADGIDPSRAREAVEAVLETRRRLERNVSEELALEALFYAVESRLRHP